MTSDSESGAEALRHRPIQSFARREGRLTPGQLKRLDTLWPHYGLAIPDQPLDWDAVFARCAPRTLEIGFGAGEVLVDLACKHPKRDFIGIEVYRTGIARLLGGIDEARLSNVRVLQGDGVEILDRAFADAILDEVLLYFPDPWPKKRHHKRRIVTADFASEVARVLKPGGLWRLATDWANYAEQMRDVIDAHPAFANVGDANGLVSNPPRATTRFETRGTGKGHDVWDFAYRRRAD